MSDLSQLVVQLVRKLSPKQKINQNTGKVPKVREFSIFMSQGCINKQFRFFTSSIPDVGSQGGLRGLWEDVLRLNEGDGAVFTELYQSGEVDKNLVVTILPLVGGFESTRNTLRLVDRLRPRPKNQGTPVSELSAIGSGN